jgi:hypothetical protein
MSEEYYVKYKGRLQGPFTVKQLKSGLESGKLSRSHLASIDRRNWVPLGEVEGVCEPEHVEEVVEEIAAEVEEEVAIPPTQQQTGDVYSQQQTGDVYPQQQPGVYPQQQQGMYPQQQQQPEMYLQQRIEHEKTSQDSVASLMSIASLGLGVVSVFHVVALQTFLEGNSHIAVTYGLGAASLFLGIATIRKPVDLKFAIWGVVLGSCAITAQISMYWTATIFLEELTKALRGGI